MHKKQNMSLYYLLAWTCGVYLNQKVQKFEGDENRYPQLKKDAHLRGRTETNKGNFDTEVLRCEGKLYPSAQTPEQIK